MAISESVVAPTATRTAPPTRRPAPSRPRTALFATTAFIGAGLLFVVQPLVAKLILPSYGGSATVWSTSSLFFQVLLLAAYGYAHASTSRLGARWQPKAHLVVLLLPLAALPLAIPGNAAPPADASPVLWLLRTLVLVIGLPFAVIATTGPLLQRWYSWGDHARSDDPYFLFAASNLGSFGGLLAYPLLIEPHLTLASQRAWWSGAFLVFVALTATCALSVRGTPRLPTVRAVRLPVTARPNRKQILTWSALAFLPSSLMLGVTSHITTDVAAIPLLWVVPLAIYLATFVLAFGRASRTPPRRATRWAVASAFAIAITSVGLNEAVTLTIVVNLVMLALVAYASHARLAAERPAAEHLTRFYLVVASGGALGGLLNGLAAPIIFDRVLEFSLVLIVVPLLLVGVRGNRAPTEFALATTVRRRRLLMLGLGVVLVPVVLRLLIWAAPASPGLLVVLLVLGLVAGWWMARLPRVMVVAVVLFFALATLGENQGVIERSRTFFGSYTVLAAGDRNELVHGTTTHGTQFRDPDRRGVATTYYSRSGPLGDVFSGPTPQSVAIVGLGAGTVAAYGQPGQELTFFEIDPEIIRIARDPALFTYLDDSPATIRTIAGDGRLGVAEAPRGSFQVIVLDAFSSDSIPVHLLTEEAISTYVDRLAPGGLLVVHISNRMFDLAPVLASTAERLGLSATVGRGEAGSEGASASRWVALSRDKKRVAQLEERPGWSPLGARKVRWTDDYSSILSVLK